MCARVYKAVCNLLLRFAAGSNLECYLLLSGFRNTHGLLAVFRFGKGIPLRQRLNYTWTTGNGAWSWLLTALDKSDSAGSKGLSHPTDSKIRIMVSFYLRTDAAWMAAVQPTIEAHPHITWQWSLPPLAYSMVILSEQLREKKVVAGEAWNTHQPCGARNLQHRLQQRRCNY